MGHLRTPCHCWSSLRNSSWNILCRDWNIARIQRSGSCAVRRIWLALVSWYRGGKHIWTSINILEVDCAVRLSSWDNYWTYSRSRVMGHIIRTCYHIWDTASTWLIFYLGTKSIYLWYLRPFPIIVPNYNRRFIGISYCLWFAVGIYSWADERIRVLSKEIDMHRATFSRDREHTLASLD